ncbi:permease prefix domain 1-containing protein [Brachybacterium sp. ACRRE]|uniref:permease prefix domain 1-containing protein n=1 Tax=Brachybacterium sp. ACRRE TaxID=2918184 RepID=UPI001EF29BF7|nr:permease prefix domain 1-containing protein [Brachybacterium sp. ACRRE]MCG7308361.1 permease prefix domain 1-containing protein [Brachybacterium sp. ACRRE]
MSVIDSYLDTLFSPYPDSPRLREARTELRAMMEDQQQDLIAGGLSESQAVGRVIAEFGTLEEVAPVLGIDAELRGDQGRAPAAPRLSLARAQEYVETFRSTQSLAAASVPLFVLCPVPLLLGIALTNGADGPARWAVGAGLTLLLALVAAGIVMQVRRRTLMAEVEDIEAGRLAPSPEVLALAKDLRQEHRGASARAFAIAVSLWILCAVPILVTSFAATSAHSMLPLYGVCLTLMMVATGLWVLIGRGWADGVADTLEQVPDDSPETSVHPAIRAISAGYWPLVTAIFLAWGFLGEAWDRAWMVWPVAAVLFGALWAVDGALTPPEEARRRRA